MAKEKTRDFGPMKCQVPDGTEIACKDCVYRDHTTVKVGDKILPVGVTKAQCEMFVYPDSKPSEVLFDNASCEFHEEE